MIIVRTAAHFSINDNRSQRIFWKMEYMSNLSIVYRKLTTSGSSTGVRLAVASSGARFAVASAGVRAPHLIYGVYAPTDVRLHQCIHGGTLCFCIPRDLCSAFASTEVCAPSEFTSFAVGKMLGGSDVIGSERGVLAEREDCAGDVDQINRGRCHRRRKGPARRMRRRTSRRGRDASDPQTEKGGGRWSRKSHNSS